MFWFGMFALVAWVPVVYLIFEAMPADRAVVVSFVFAWLFLPTLQIPLSGLPDWSKMTATTSSIALIAYMKHSGRLAQFRFRWYDTPALIYCVTPIIPAVTTGMGLYDGISACLEETVRWGLPYLIGRVFLGSLRGNFLLCMGFVVGGLVYAPLCLFEIRMSPILKLWVYGFVNRGELDFSMRWGGFRPIVFLSFGLETGWWMCCSAAACTILWRSGAVKRLRGYPMSVLTAGMILVAFACKSTGALVLIIFGVLVFGAARLTRSTLPVWALLLIPPAYCVCRPLGVWDGSSLVSLSYQVFGPARAQSLAYRFEQEEILMRSAMQRPIFGWSRFGGFNPPGPDGKSAVTDGLWIIVFGATGYVGLVALNGVLLLPTVLFMRRFPIKRWLEPEVAPTLTFAILLPLYMLDNLSNAMVNPIFTLASGAVLGYVPSRVAAGGGRRGALRGGDHPGQIGADSRRRLARDPSDNPQADEHEAAALAAAEQGDGEFAWEQFGLGIACRRAAVDQAGTPDRLDRLARSHVLFARFLTQLGYLPFAVDQRSQAVQAWRGLLAPETVAASTLAAYASNLNDLAWLLIADPAGDPARFDRAVALAEEAVQVEAEHPSYWNTLGIGYYRRGEHYKAIRALSQAVGVAADGGNAFDFYYLALANHALGYTGPAQDWLSRADAWAAGHPELGGPLAPVRAEVAAALG